MCKIKELIEVVDPRNVFTLTTFPDFNKGDFDNVLVTKNNGGEVRLSKINNGYVSKGVFTSNVIVSTPFSKLITSWNSDTPVGTEISVEAQVIVNGEWSDWISWGTWSTNKERSSVKDDNNTKLAGIMTDTLYVKDGKSATAFRLKSTLKSADPKATPILRSVSVTIDLGGGAKRVYPQAEDITAIENVDIKLKVVSFSQYTRDPQISDSICSPTSATCVVNYYQDRYEKPSVLPEESAYAIYDSVDGKFGNWSFGVAYIASFGLNSRVEFCASLYDLKREIYSGNPVIISVRNARNEKNTEPDCAKFPLLQGFPILSTRGHLITVTGFTKVDGIEYVCVNDSAAKSDVSAKRMYLANEFDSAWETSGRVAYITNDLDGIPYNPIQKLTSTLIKTENTKKNGLIEYYEYQLESSGRIIDLSTANAKINMISKDGDCYQYITPNLEINLWLAKNLPSGKYRFLFITKDNKEYITLHEI